MLVQGHGSGQPVGARLRADQDEQRRRRDRPGGAGGIAQGEVLQLPGAARGDDLGAQPHRDGGVGLDLPDQVVGHGPAERAAARQDRHPPGVLGQVHGGLAGRVAGADHKHLAARHRRGLADRRAVEHPGADQLLHAGRVQPPVVGAGGHDHRPVGRLAPVDQADQPIGPAALQPGRAGVDQLGAEQDRLVAGPLGEVTAADPAGEAEVVADQGAAAGLPADRLGLEQQGAEPF